MHLSVWTPCTMPRHPVWRWEDKLDKELSLSFYHVCFPDRTHLSALAAGPLPTGPSLWSRSVLSWQSPGDADAAVQGPHSRTHCYSPGSGRSKPGPRRFSWLLVVAHTGPSLSLLMSILQTYPSSKTSHVQNALACRLKSGLSFQMALRSGLGLPTISGLYSHMSYWATQTQLQNCLHQNP